MRVSPLVGAAVALLMTTPMAAQTSVQTPAPAPTTTGQSPAQTPGQPAVPAPGQTPPPTAAAPGQSPVPSATTASRTFTAPAGLLFNTVRPDRVADFERVIGYLQAALAKSSDATGRAQAQGWRVFKAAEPGPGNTVLYVFVIDPTVPSADYGLGHILADAYPDTAQLQEIWRLYTGAVTSGGSLLNLSPVQPPPPGSKPGAPRLPATGPSTTPPATTPERPLPPDADPNRQPLTPGQP